MHVSFLLYTPHHVRHMGGGPEGSIMCQSGLYRTEMGTGADPASVVMVN